MRKPLGQLLLEKSLLADADLARALAVQRQRRERLGKILTDLGFLTRRDVLATLAEQLNLPLLVAAELPEVPPEFEKLSPNFMRQFRFVPLRAEDSRLTIAMADPLDYDTIQSVRLLTRCEVDVWLAAEEDVLAALEKFYGSETTTEVAAEAGPEAEDIEHLKDLASEVPVIRLVNYIITQAIERRASDIHFEPFERDFRVRFRIDGVLYPVESPPRGLRAAVLSRLKLMAKLNIAERRLPQDGRIQLKVLGRDVDMRVSTLPTLWGESVVIRLLDRGDSSRFDLHVLGFTDEMFRGMERYTARPHGIFLVTGPTGSGKSTTLYSALRRLNSSERKIITIEDPVEYQVEGINQIHVNPQIGLTFATGLRHIVRQDPDVIMVGEIRDLETAEIAIRAALTGHLVFSTLHTNDAPSAITRLTDMGVENYLISSSLIAVLAQRLVRVICPDCKESYEADGVLLRSQGFDVKEDGPKLWRGRGCEACHQTGYQGRVGIFELMELSDEIRRMIVANADANRLAETARRAGMRTLREDGWEKVRAGTTSVDEVLRVTQEL